MAELIKRENTLPTIKVSLTLEGAATGTSPIVQLEIDRGSDATGRLKLTAQDLNIPPGFDPATYRYSEPSFAIAERLWPAIQRPVQVAMEDAKILWLQLAPPLGDLAVLPWERMLEPIVGQIPIVRIPGLSLLTPLSVDRIDIVVCMSEPRAKDPFDGSGLLRRLVSSLQAIHPLEPYVHIFTDRETHAELSRPGEGQLGSQKSRVILHDPAGVPPVIRSAGEGSLSDPSGAVTNPWLLWIIDEMRESTAEAVHFVTHGYLRNGQSALALAESPRHNDDSLWSRFIGPNQLAACLAQLGAWMVGFTSPPQNFSHMGLRQFFDEVARLRAGPVLHHDATRDQHAEDLAGAYAELFQSRSPSTHRAVSMYAHPALFAESGSPDSLLFESFADTLVTNALGPTEPTTEDPAWVTTTRRYLEQSVAQLFPDQSQDASKIQRAAGEGVDSALRFVNDVLRDMGATDR
jgi:hypothetical protein